MDRFTERKKEKREYKKYWRKLSEPQKEMYRAMKMDPTSNEVKQFGDKFPELEQTWPEINDLQYYQVTTWAINNRNLEVLKAVVDRHTETQPSISVNHLLNNKTFR